MGMRVLHEFLKLYPHSVTRAVRRGAVVAAVSSLLDFASLLFLFPVFVSLTANGSDSKLTTPLDSILPLSVDTYIVLAMICMITRSITAYVLRAWWMKQVAAADVSLSNRLLSSYVYAPFEFHLSHNSAELMSRAVSNVNSATFSGLAGLLVLVTDSTTVVSLGAALLVASPLPGLVVCGYLGFVGTLFTIFSRRFTTRFSQEYARHVTQVYRRTATVLRGVRELTVANAQEPVLRSVRDARGGMTKAQRRLALLTDIPRLTLETALYGAVLVALLIVVSSDHPSKQLPVVALYVVAGLRVLPAVSRALGTMTQLRSGMEIGRELRQELDRFNRDSAPATPPQRVRRATLAITDLAFRYSEGPSVLSEVTLTVEPGAFVGIVGPSGGGKSTLLNIMLGLLRPTGGVVTWGGEPIAAADPSWFERVGYVPQESYMLDDSIVANVALGHPEVDVERARSALARAGLGGVVDSLPNGIDTGVGENGSRLSVGQRQRLGLARALYRQPSILILDEPTAALDAETERLVVESICELRGELSIVMVSHRRPPLAGADCVYTLVEGRLARELAPSAGQA